jgi:small GTP-binding protein
MIDLKCSLIGSSGVGKTFIFNMLFDKSINNISQTTGPTTQTKIFKVGIKPIQIKFIDTSGSDRFRNISRGYFKHSDIVLLVFDLTNRKSFEDLTEWMNDILALCEPKTHILLIGNKKEFAAKRQVSRKEVKQFSDKFDLTYQEISTFKESEIKPTIQKFVNQIIPIDFPKLFLKNRNYSISNLF